MKQLAGMFRSDRLGRMYGGAGKDVGDFVRFTDTRINMASELTKEHGAEAHIHVNVHDFQVPRDEQRFKYALLIAAQALADGRDVVVNCMGGVGRTGLFMAAFVGLVKPGVGDPVTFVRENYISHAVETREQQEWVAGFVRRNQALGATLRMIIRRATKSRRATQSHLHPVANVSK